MARRSTCGLVVALVLASRVVQAQSADTKQKTFFVREDLVFAGLFTGVSIGLSIFDPRIAHYFQDTSLAHVRFGQRADDIFTHVNETTLTVGGIAVYGIGRLAGSELVTDVALHATEAVVAASLTAQVIRGPLGRSRPKETNLDDQYDFHFMKGFSNFKYRAFPSIHSGSGFAAAAAIVAETRRRKPDAVWIVAPVAFGLAATPGLARMYLGQHWASDIFAGAALGTFYGYRVVDYSHSHARTPVDRVFLPHIMASRSRVGLSWDF